MKTQEFIDKLKEALEAEDAKLTKESLLKSIPGYDSMAVLSIIAFVDENFNKKLTAVQLNSLTTIASLMDLIGNENFND